MTSLLTSNVLLFAGECLAGSVVVLGLAAIATSFLKQAALRHFVWLTAFGAMLMLPVAAFVVPPQIVVHHKAAAVAAMTDDASLPVYTPPENAVPETGVEPAPSAAPAWKIDAHTIALGLLVLWLVGFGCALLRLLFGAIGVNALQLSSVPLPEDELRRLPEACADCELRIADDNRGPLTWGYLRPVILLPREAAEWSRERLRAVLLHEMAHVRRGDSFAQAVSLVACALYWPNPLAWIGARLMRREAEMAADDEVLNAGVRPSDYAGELLQLAAEYRGASFAGLSMASRPALEERVKSILAANPFRRGVRSMDILKIAGFGLVATAALAFARPTLAEDTPPPPSPPPAVSQAELPPLPPPAVSQTKLPPLPPVPPALAENDVPAPQNPPGVPDAPAAPPAPPAPSAAPAPPAPPAPPADADAASGHDIIIDEPHHHLHIHTGQAMSAADRAKLHEILRNVHTEVRAAMEKARPEMERAMAELRAHREEMKTLRPQIERAMHDAGPDMERAMAELRAHRAEMEKIRPQIEQAMREARPEIEKAMSEARQEIEKAKLDEKTKSHVERVLERVQARMDAAHQRHLVIVQRHDGKQVVNTDHDMDNDHDADNDNDHDADNDHHADNDHDMDNDHDADADHDADDDEGSGGDHTSVNAPHPRQ